MGDDVAGDDYNEYAVLQDCSCEHDEESHQYPDGGCKIEGCPCKATWDWPNG